jgi:hypothetical protein
VIGIRIEDKLRVRQVALKNERIRGIDDHVMATVDHQRRLGDFPELVKRAPARSPPFAKRGDLRRRDFFAHLRVASLLAQAEPFQKRLPRSLARLGRCEGDAKPHIVRVFICLAEHGL